MGVVVSETRSEIEIATARVIANSRKSRPTIPPMRRIGMKTATSEILIERTVNPISLCSLQSGFHRRNTLLEVTRNVLDHHDRVIDHESGRNGQRHQRKVIERVAKQVHHAECAKQREVEPQFPE